ncbi:unnamed protein product [Larinioides sclopetarius]|uniref:Ribosomal protein S10 n=1 Tax=Larinioides sclopetarius TaxID=280406 RepID=A0AAV1YZG6_9ARAC
MFQNVIRFELNDTSREAKRSVIPVSTRKTVVCHPLEKDFVRNMLQDSDAGEDCLPVSFVFLFTSINLFYNRRNFQKVLFILKSKGKLKFTFNIATTISDTDKRRRRDRTGKLLHQNTTIPKQYNVSSSTITPPAHFTKARDARKIL